MTMGVVDKDKCVVLTFEQILQDSLVCRRRNDRVVAYTVQGAARLRHQHCRLIGNCGSESLDRNVYDPLLEPPRLPAQYKMNVRREPNI